MPSFALPSSAMPSFALPSFALPSRAKQLISDYSKPVTNPEWRKSKPITTTYSLFRFALLSRSVHLYDILMHNIKQTEWYKLYRSVLIHGIKQTLIDFNITQEYLLKIQAY
jgi:hypothetical protein